MGRACVCGHMRAVHAHYRAGSDCAACACHAYHPRQRVPFGFRWLARYLRDALDE